MDLFIYVVISCYMRFLREISGVDFILSLRQWLLIWKGVHCKVKNMLGKRISGMLDFLRRRN